MAGFSIDGRLAGAGDIQRAYMFEVDIARSGYEPLTIKARSAEIPQRASTPIDSHFMGTKQSFPGLTNFTGLLSVEYEEFEGMDVTRYITVWMNSIFNYDVDSGGAFAGTGLQKSAIKTDITLKMYTIDGSNSMKVKFHNAWPESINDTNLNYTSNEAVKRTVGFRFDYWTIV